jgi:hypothetical protein
MLYKLPASAPPQGVALILLAESICSNIIYLGLSLGRRSITKREV